MLVLELTQVITCKRRITHRYKCAKVLNAGKLRQEIKLNCTNQTSVVAALNLFFFIYNSRPSVKQKWF